MRCPDPRHVMPPTPLFSRGELDFVVCPECGLAFRQQMPTPRDLDAIYEAAYAPDRIGLNETNQESGEYALTAYRRFLERTALRSGMRVLDFGAGTGALVTQLRTGGFAADGFEFSPAARMYCSEHRGINLVGELTAIPEASYDLVTMIEVIEHLTDLTGTLQRLYSALKPGGVLFVTTPNRRGMRALLQGGYWREAQKKFHLLLFDRRSLRHYLRGAGFEMVDQIRFSPLQRPGARMWFVGRGLQFIGRGGTLCFTAQKTAGSSVR